jgi:hypothetical protein
MKLVYTQKGLEYRKELKNSLLQFDRFDDYRGTDNPLLDSKMRSNKNLHENSFLKGNNKELDGSFKLPDFENLRVEVVKTARGEIKEKPFMLAKELDKEKYRESAQFNLGNQNPNKLSILLSDVPPNIHKNASKGMILPPKPPLQTSSVVDILGTVESPSHWRYFENKKKELRSFSPSAKNLKSFNDQMMNSKKRFFSPEATSTNFTSLENKFPFNFEKIFRKHAQEQEKRKVIRYGYMIYYHSLALLHRRKLNENKKKLPELSEKHLQLVNDLQGIDITNLLGCLAQEDTSLKRFKNRIKSIHTLKYQKEWKSRQFIDRLFSKTQANFKTFN